LIRRINTIFKWLVTHEIYISLICSKNPPQEHKKEQKKDDEGYGGPYRDVVNVSQYIFIHGFSILI